MQHAKTFAWGLSFVIGLAGCAAVPAPQSVPAGKAVVNATRAQFGLHSYRMHLSAHISGLTLDTGKANGSSSGTPDTAATAPTHMSEIQLMPAPAFLTGTIAPMLQRMDFEADGVVDLRRRQFEFNPVLTYKAVNAGAYIKFPMMFDLASNEGYIDLSATSPFVAKAANDGKYSEFSLKSFTDRVDVEKLFAWLRDTSVDNYAAIDPVKFQDQPLGAADAAAGGVRKISLRLSQKAFMQAHAQVLEAHKAEFQAVIKDNGASKDVNFDSSPADHLVDSLKNMGTPADPEKAEKPSSGEDGMVETTFLLDSSGRILEIDYHAIIKPAASSLTIDAAGSIHYSDFDDAEVAFRPTADNTVAWADNKQPTEAPARRANATATPATAAAPVKNSFVGTWRPELTGECPETYYVTGNNTILLTSGNDIAFVRYSLSGLPDQRGFYRAFMLGFTDTGKPACPGSAIASEPNGARYLQFRPDHTQTRICTDQALTHCTVLNRVKEAGEAMHRP